jgi:hypothetical protein
MATWKTFMEEAGELAEKVEARFRANTHHVMATIRADGAPRVSGTEVDLRGEHVYLGSMWRARKALDLQRDPRVAVHSNPSDSHMVGGDAKFSAVAEEVPDDDAAKADVRADQQPPEPFHLFRLDLLEVVLTEVDEDAQELHVHLWRPGWAIRTTVLK